MLFNIVNDVEIKESNPEISNFPKMFACTDRELRWIFFVYDYDTPLRKIPIDLRKEKAADIAGFLREKGSARLDKNARNTITGKIERVNEAIEEFMSIQYDQDKDLLQSYSAQIRDASELMKKEKKTDKDWTILIRLNKELPSIVKNKKELELIVGHRSEEEGAGDQFDEEEPLSTLDLLHMDEDI